MLVSVSYLYMCACVSVFKYVHSRICSLCDGLILAVDLGNYSPKQECRYLLTDRLESSATCYFGDGETLLW